jgi:hypothetical protein
MTQRKKEPSLLMAENRNHGHLSDFGRATTVELLKGSIMKEKPH